ncbi:hypothetical protein SAMN04487785_11328 [Dyella jiangningensis]|nr:hypothetical protein BDW41_102609 [Dyella sp. AtDHG13]SDK94764.1 hypothetical protein SAMN04487785_11328 [Dyella jiangningensis]
MRLRYLVFFIMAFCLRTVHAEEKHVIYTDAQLHGIWLGIKGQCETLAKAEGKPHLYD